MVYRKEWTVMGFLGNTGEVLEIREGEHKSSFGNAESELLFQFENDDVKWAAEREDWSLRGRWENKSG